MKKHILYICIISIIIFSVACKNEENTVVTTSTTNADATTVTTEEATQKNIEIYVGMPRDEFYAKNAVNYINDYHMNLGNIVTFLDGDEGVIVTFKGNKEIIDIKRFKEPTKRAKVSDLKEGMNIYEAIEIVGVKNLFILGGGNYYIDVAVVLDEGTVYVCSEMHEDFHKVDNICEFRPYYSNKIYLASNEELHNECEEDDDTDARMYISRWNNLYTYGDIVAIFGKPQRIKSAVANGWHEVYFEWDIVASGIEYTYRAGFVRSTLYYSYSPEADINDMHVTERELIYPKITQ